MTQTLEAMPQAPMSPDELTARVYDTQLSPEVRAPYVVARDLLAAAKKAYEVKENAYELSGEINEDRMGRAAFVQEYAAVCAGLPEEQDVKKELPYSQDRTQARAWVPYPNHVVPVDIKPQLVREVLHGIALQEHVDRGYQVPVEGEPRRRGFAKVLGWLGLNRLARRK